MVGNRRRGEWCPVSTNSAEKGIGRVEARVWKRASSRCRLAPLRKRTVVLKRSIVFQFISSDTGTSVPVGSACSAQSWGTWWDTEVPAAAEPRRTRRGWPPSLRRSSASSHGSLCLASSLYLSIRQTETWGHKRLVYDWRLTNQSWTDLSRSKTSKSARAHKHHALTRYMTNGCRAAVWVIWLLHEDYMSYTPCAR